MDNMYRRLDKLRLGIIDPVAFKSTECKRRSGNLQLSVLRDVENVHSSGINTLDADNESGSYLLSGCVDGSIYMHDLRNFTGSPCYTSKFICKVDKKNANGHKFSVETVQWYPFDNGFFTSSGMDRELKIWDTSTMKPVEGIRFQGRIFQHHICPIPMNTKCLIAVAATMNQVLLTDLRTGCHVHELKGHTSYVMCCKWSPTQEYILATGGADNRLLLWDVRSSKACLSMVDKNNRRSSSAPASAHNGFINGLCFTRNGHKLISFGTDCRLKLWNGTTGEHESVDYGIIANETKKSVQIDVSENTNGYNDFIYVPSDGNIFILELNTGAKVKTLVGHYNTVKCCYFHTPSVQLYSGGNDRNVICWSDEETQLDVFEEAKICSGRSKPSISKSDTWSSEDEQ